MEHERRSGDMNLLCERLADRLAADGAPHPGAAALSIAVRGLRGCDRHAFAAELGLTPNELSDIEHGDVAWAQLPAEILRLAVSDGRIDLARLQARSA